jgi:hypothetical protein
MAGDKAFSEGSRLVAEAGVALDRLRKLGDDRLEVALRRARRSIT